METEGHHIQSTAKPLILGRTTSEKVDSGASTRPPQGVFTTPRFLWMRTAVSGTSTAWYSLLESPFIHSYDCSHVSKSGLS